MKVICAPDKFKESLSAAAAAEAMAAGVRRAKPDATIDVCPISDGGEGFVDTMLAAMPGRGQRIVTEVHGPLGEQRDAKWGLIEAHYGEPRTAVIEMAAASGLALVPPGRRDATMTTTYGTGELIRTAIAEHGCRRVLVGIGGSATCDGGCGMAQAIGVTFTDASGERINQAITGGILTDIAGINMATRRQRTPGIGEVEVIVACDVTNPLTGPNGAAYVYGPQKGASAAQVEQLDAGLAHVAKLLRDEHGIDVETLPGAGAAGGLGAGLVAFAGATLKPGIELVLDAVQFDERVNGADLVLTGEGRLDGQSVSGKACIGVAQAARRHGVSTVALVGALGPQAERTLEAGLAAYFVIGEGLSNEESMRRAAELIERAAERVVRGRAH